MDNEPQMESSGASKVSAYENKRREKSGKPHVMTMAARRAVCKNKAPKITEEWSSKTYRMRMLGEANANGRHSPLLITQILISLPLLLGG